MHSYMTSLPKELPIETLHTFHIPVMGTAFTIDTPIRVARFGISSVISIVDDELCEYTRRHYCEIYGFNFDPIEKKEEDVRARRIRAYLDVVHDIVQIQFDTLRKLPFEPGNELTRYFDLLPAESPLKADYQDALAQTDSTHRHRMLDALKPRMRAGSIDVNIMTKLDRNNYSKDGELLPDQFSDALASLRGYATSKLISAIIFSAGFNRRLYSYIEHFSDFFPDEHGFIKKKIILKVSDYRSSLTQGKFLAKKGLWVSEHRIESGLNCGGHVFPSDGYVLGPILEEFKKNRDQLRLDLFEVTQAALTEKGRVAFPHLPYFRLTVQGGIGTANEQQFMCDYYGADGTGWGSPFLLVPEAVNLDDVTRELLIKAGPDDFYTSGVSPLGVRFNTVKGTLSEQQKMQRVQNGKPGSPCPKGYLVSNTEFTKVPICTASTTYQKRKLAELETLDISEEARQERYDRIIAKVCLCEDLAAPALINFHQSNKRPLMSAICPGPNLAYFNRIVSLDEMIGHIYGWVNLLNTALERPSQFVLELKIYITFLEKEIHDSLPSPTPKQCSYFALFKQNLESAIDYYLELIPNLTLEAEAYRDVMRTQLADVSKSLALVTLPA